MLVCRICGCAISKSYRGCCAKCYKEHGIKAQERTKELQEQCNQVHCEKYIKERDQLRAENERLIGSLKDALSAIINGYDNVAMRIIEKALKGGE